VNPVAQPPLVQRQGKVSVIGAGQCGRMTAQRIAEQDVFESVVLTDVVEGRAEGIALDINQSRPLVGFETRVIGRTSRPDGSGNEALHGSETVVIAAGAVPQPHRGPEEMVLANMKIVDEAVRAIMSHAAGAVVIVMTNPVDTMTALAGAMSGLPASRVMGQSMLLDTARFTDFVAGVLSVPRSSVSAITVGAHAHGQDMIPLLSSAGVNGTPLTSLLARQDLDRAVASTRRGGADVVRLLGTHSSFYAASAAAARMVRAIKDDNGTVVPVCAFAKGSYGLSGVWLGVPAQMGRRGIQQVVEVPLASEERQALAQAAHALKREQDRYLEIWRCTPHRDTQAGTE
jgi:malate dehydrogenase